MARLRGLLLGLGPWLLTALLTALVLPAVAYAINVDRVDGAVSALLVGQDGKALASTGAGGLNIAPVAPLTLTSTTSPQLTVAYDGSHSLTTSVASNGNVTLTPTGTLGVTSSSADAFDVGPTGATNPVVKMDMTGSNPPVTIYSHFAPELVVGYDATHRLTIGSDASGNITLTPTGSLNINGSTSITSGTFNVATGGSTTISTGVGVVHMSTANPATNVAWIPIAYAGTTYYVPAYTTNAP